jgi:hypothetical protein
MELIIEYQATIFGLVLFGAFMTWRQIIAADGESKAHDKIRELKIRIMELEKERDELKG